MTPHVEVVEEGSEGAQLFESLLIDDPDPDEPAEYQQEQQQGAEGAVAAAGGQGGQQPAPGGRLGFEQHVKAEVALQLQPE